MTTLKIGDYINKQLSECPAGISGYRLVSEEEVGNRLSDETNINIIDADDFISQFSEPKGFVGVSQTLSTLKWWDVFNQGSIGSCFGVADSQTTTGVNWMKTGKRVEFDKFFHYLCCQYMADLKKVRPRSLGKDTGSIPSMGLIVAATWGYLPSSLSAKLGLGYPRDYSTGLRAYGPLLQQLQDPNSEVRKAMAPYRMDKYIPIKNTGQIRAAKRKGLGFIQANSVWPRDMDLHQLIVKSFSDSKDPANKHAGGHAWQIMDIAQAVADLGITENDFVIGNSWGMQWGDEGTKYILAAVLDAIIQDSMSVFHLKTDLPHVVNTQQRESRVIPLRREDMIKDPFEELLNDLGA
jgi:hypothetical protein